MRPGPHHIGTSGASDGDFLGYDPDTDEYGPMAPPSGSGITGLTSADASVTITDNGDGTLDLAAVGGGGGGGGTGNDRRWNVGAGETSIDEFNDGTLNAGWTRVDGTGAVSGNVGYTEAADVLSVENKGGDSAATIHGLVRALSGFGGSLATGDGIVTCMTILGPWGVNYSQAGLLLCDGTTHGSGKQVTGVISTSSGNTKNVNAESYSNWNTRSAAVTTINALGQGGALYLRLALISSGTWRLDASPDDITWFKSTSTVSQSFTPTHVGFTTTSYGTSTKSIAAFEFIRRVSGVT